MTVSAHASPFPALGTILVDRYELVEEIGRGGFSVVYGARDRELHTDVAIKLLVPPPASAQLARDRMRREVHAVRRIRHPNVVHVYDFQEEGSWSFIVMERIAGKNLAQHVAANGPLSIDDALEVGVGVATALEAAHDHGILHRDVKPQNVLLEVDGTPRLVDFGSARVDGHTLTGTGGLVGTIQYTAPELLQGERADARADVYALGVTLYFALAGRLPPGTTSHSAPAPHQDGHRPSKVRIEVPEWLDDAVAAATAADPDRRFPTVTSFHDALRRQSDLVSPVDDHQDGPEHCVICRASEPFGLGICPACSGSVHGQGDTLIFVRETERRRDTDQIAQALVPLLEGRAHAADRHLVAAGHRALMKVPAVTADTVLQTLGERGIPAQAKKAITAWTAVPWPFYGMLLAVVIVGGAAGITAAPLLLWTSPLMAALLLLAGQRRLQRPVLTPSRRQPIFPANVERQVIETFAQLPGGSARGLLTRLVRAAEPTYRALLQARFSPVPTEQLDVLLEQACAAALDLADLEQSLELLETSRQLETADVRWVDGLVRTERLRDALVQRFLNGVTVLHRLRARSVEIDPTRQLLDELIDGIGADVEAHAAAVEEIEELLAPSHAA